MSKIISLAFEYDHEYDLIAITSTLEDYRLAYSLNQQLKLRLNRDQFGLALKDDCGTFSTFSYTCQLSFCCWSLIENKTSINAPTASEGNLFPDQSQQSYLINEKKNVDFFLKIEEGNQTLKPLIERIKNISGVITAFIVNPQSLKSKDYLIF